MKRQREVSINSGIRVLPRELRGELKRYLDVVDNGPDLIEDIILDFNNFISRFNVTKSIYYKQINKFLVNKNLNIQISSFHPIQIRIDRQDIVYNEIIQDLIILILTAANEIYSILNLQGDLIQDHNINYQPNVILNHVSLLATELNSTLKHYYCPYRIIIYTNIYFEDPIEYEINRIPQKLPPVNVW